MKADARRGRLLGLALVAAGVLLIVYCASSFLLAGWRQREDGARWHQIVARVPGRPQPVSAAAAPVDGLDFRLLVPRVEYDAVVREGVGLDVLATGPGHYPGTAWPGRPGTIGVAAHNVFWIRFDQLRAGDELVVQARYGTFRYAVTGTRVVSPSDLSVLQSVPGQQLTLTTCWPLWAGELANQRLAIFATERR